MAYVRVYKVTKVAANLLKSNPPSLCVTADGEVNSTGWSDPELSQWVYIVPPKDGIQDFDFLAKKPTGIVLWVISKISADTLMESIDILNYWGKGEALKGIRIHAATNSMEYKFPQKMKKSKSATILSDKDPWPW